MHICRCGLTWCPLTEVLHRDWSSAHKPREDSFNLPCEVLNEVLLHAWDCLWDLVTLVPQTFTGCWVSSTSVALAMGLRGFVPEARTPKWGGLDQN